VLRHWCSTISCIPIDLTHLKSIYVSLETGGRPSAPPFNPSAISVPSSAISVPPTAKSLQSSFASPTARFRLQPNIFVSIASGNPPAQVSRRADHPVSQLGITRQDSPVHTNKFYANFFLGTQHQPVWTHPYSLQWADGSGNLVSYGMSVSHIERKQLAYGPGDPAQYFINPVGIRSIVLSAVELGRSTVLTTSSVQSFSINAQLAPSARAKPIIVFPIVQGMGCVTALYSNASVLLQSGVSFGTINFVQTIQQSGTYKYDITLQDGTTWLMYVTPTRSSGTPPFRLTSSTSITGPTKFTGTIQVAKNPIGAAGESFYDRSAGAYALSASISGSVDQRSGTYTVFWKKGGRTDQNLLMFALPHHVESMDDATRNRLTPIQLQTTTKGLAVAIISDNITLVEDNLPVDVGFDPWSPALGSVRHVSNDAARAIANAAAIELNQNIAQQSDLNSMYYSGKVSLPYLSNTGSQVLIYRLFPNLRL
jgi:endo-1,3(4)-beta-glucanase